MVDNIMMEFRCKECDVEFPTQSSVNSHMEEVHNSVRDQELIQEAIHQEKKAEVIPDENFLTQNTAVLVQLQWFQFSPLFPHLLLLLLLLTPLLFPSIQYALCQYGNRALSGFWFSLDIVYNGTFCCNGQI